MVNNLSVQADLQKIRKEKLQPCYLVLGTEKFLQDQVREEILKKIQVDSKDDLNFLSFDMENASLDEVVAEAETLPFFGEQRLVFVENPYFLTGEKVNNGIEQNTDLLVDYLKAPLESTVLVFFAPYEKLDERKKVTKQLKKTAITIDVKQLNEKEVRQYLMNTLNNSEIEMDRYAIDLFLRLTDLDLSKLMRELQKLMLFAQDQKKITTKEVEQLVPKTLEHNLFDMTQYVLTGNTEQALRLYEDLVLQGEETIKINAILLAQLRLLLQTKFLIKIGYQQANIAETLKVHPYRVKLAMQEVRRFDEGLLIRLFDRLVELDYQIKTGQIDKELSFQLFVLQAGQLVRK
ncbi:MULTISPECIES: DNA polymerase III subunit delta [Enterococcus]|uniref:DNA polymerase III subunit delta n=1 Tax=Enterococcus thailandicus TaxID=417368 RepID=A0A179EW86_ENTTH|nr:MULTISPECIES: DNA polymerase III subunit delta [Enterococcus]ASZ07780.1 DNA polymerase III subunit delta [Enterococcus thailandicus]MDA3963917.1 DNA polymerase III subunit delta [Enterococcus thailandicus]MDT2750522.1 DNA polymerase III subunit delta [Enterococcus thailandicus]MDT2775082.1 DNA polymerase III subunit delta [Enterococcus thailandicus]MDT2793578.1 DNA polymerase III subunit delta [Enterococcus thailandicus]